MSRVGTPTDNPIMEAPNGWMKEKLRLDFGLATTDDIPLLLHQYRYYLNNKHPATVLCYKSPVQYNEPNRAFNMVFLCLLYLKKYTLPMVFSYNKKVLDFRLEIKDLLKTATLYRQSPFIFYCHYEQIQHIEIGIYYSNYCIYLKIKL